MALRNVLKALGVLLLLLALSSLLFIAQPQFSMREVFFEVFSAFGTVGLSMGITPELSTFSKTVIMRCLMTG